MENSEDGEEDEVKVVEEEPEDKKEAEGEEETEEEKEAETDKKKFRQKHDIESPAPKKKKTGVSMVGLMIMLVGALGLVGAFVFDPIMNMMDSSHPADINIGNTQMIGIVVAAIVLVVGIIITVLMRKKPSRG